MFSSYKETIEYTSDFIWEVDKNGVYTYVNKVVERTLGYLPSEMIGKTPFDFMPEKEKIRVEDIFKDIVVSERDFDTLENINLHKDGHEVVLETSGTAIFNEEGNLIGYRGIDRDISDKKELEMELEQKNLLLKNLLVNQSKMALIGEMLHELSNEWKKPLSEILVASSGVQMQREYNVLTNDTLDNAMTTINNSVKKLTNGIQRFDVFFKDDSEKTIYELTDVIKSTLDLMPIKEITINQKIHKSTLVGLEKKLIQVLANIMLKLKSMMYNSGTVEKYLFIGTKEVDNVVYITIKDNSGINTSDFINRIFNPSSDFKYINDENICLHTCKEIVLSQLYGSILAKNVSYDYEEKSYQGVEFVVSIPKIVV